MKSKSFFNLNSLDYFSMEKYFGFDISKIEEKGLEGNLTEMNPKEFIQKTLPGASFNEIEEYIDKLKAENYSKKMLQGELFPIPYLIIYSNQILHEGRHRAYAAMLLNIEKILVKIINREEKSFYLWK